MSNLTNIYCNRIPCTHFLKCAQVIPEQSISQTVSIYEEALPYIQCQLRSTIKHEAAHRQDEETRNKDILTHQQDRSWRGKMDFDQFSAENRVEPIAERAEEGCETMHPQEISGRTVQLNLNQVFEEAKTAANTPYANDIKAGTLDPKAQGMYLMQDLPESIAVKPGTAPNRYEGFDGSLWIDVRKIVEPFVAEQSGIQHPTTYQSDGTESDLPGISQKPPTSTSIPARPFIPSTPSIPGR